jgi:hypothetical protein
MCFQPILNIAHNSLMLKIIVGFVVAAFVDDQFFVIVRDTSEKVTAGLDVNQAICFAVY